MNQTKNTLSLLLLSSLILSACAQTAQDPESVADKYWQSLQVGNTLEAEKLVTLNSRQAFTEAKDRYTQLTQVTNSGAETLVKTTIVTVNPVDNTKQTQSFDTVLVLEQGEWKVDANRSQVPPLPASDEDSGMTDNFESIDRALNDSMQKLNKALKEGSKEMGDSFMHLMNELNSSMKESLDKLKERRQQDRHPQLPQDQPPSDGDEGMI